MREGKGGKWYASVFGGLIYVCCAGRRLRCCTSGASRFYANWSRGAPDLATGLQGPIFVHRNKESALVSLCGTVSCSDDIACPGTRLGRRAGARARDAGRGCPTIIRQTKSPFIDFGGCIRRLMCVCTGLGIVKLREMRLVGWCRETVRTIRAMQRCIPTPRYHTYMYSHLDES